MGPCNCSYNSRGLFQLQCFWGSTAVCPNTHAELPVQDRRRASEFPKRRTGQQQGGAVLTDSSTQSRIAGGVRWERCAGPGRGGAEGPAQRGSGSAARGASAAPRAGLLRDRPKGHGRCAVLCLPVAALSSSAADTAAAGVLGGDGWVTAQALTQQRQGDPSARVARAAAGLCGDTLSQFLWVAITVALFHMASHHFNKFQKHSEDRAFGVWWGFQHPIVIACIEGRAAINLFQSNLHQIFKHSVLELVGSRYIVLTALCNLLLCVFTAVSKTCQSDKWLLSSEKIQFS